MVLAPPREDKYPLPPPGTDLNFEPEEGEVVYMSKDSAPAALNAAKKVWLKNQEVQETTCFVHGSIIWLKKGKNRAHFNDKENAELFRGDLNTYKICPFIHLLPYLREAMIMKWWCVPISEPVAAEKWNNSWGNKRITMVEANEDSPLGGSILSDNNTIEGGTNHGDKVSDPRVLCGSRADQDYGFMCLASFCE